MLSVKNLEKEDMMGISKIVNEEKDKDEQCLSSPKDQKRAECWRIDAVVGVFFIFLEREHLLSRISADRTVGSRRSKKESCSTRRGLRVGTDLVEY